MGALILFSWVFINYSFSNIRGLFGQMSSVSLALCALISILLRVFYTVFQIVLLYFERDVSVLK